MNLKDKIISEKLAKLIAKEGVKAIFKNIPTAMFDIENRVLYLPNWSDISYAERNLMICHEVSHALWTPNEYVEVLKEYPFLNSILNVCEDHRVDNKMKSLYEGTKKEYRAGYNDLHNRDFFGISKIPVNERNFIDRMNIYSKLNFCIIVPFSDDEKVMVEKIKSCRTFDDVIAVAHEVFEFMKEEKKKEDEKEKEGDKSLEDENKEFEESESSPDESSSSDENNESSEGEETESEESESGDESDDESSESSSEANGDDESEESDDESSGSGTEESEENENEESEGDVSDSEGSNENSNSDSDSDELNPDDFSADSMDEFEKNMESTADLNTEIVMADLAYPSLENVLDKSIFVNRAVSVVSWPMNVTNACDAMRGKAKRVASYLKNEFEMRRTAMGYKNETEVPTGKIDLKKIYKYKVSDNIFKKAKSIITDTTNHRLLIFLDCSSSMRGSLFENSVLEIMILVEFCKMVNAKFAVYGFFNDNMMNKYWNSNSFIYSASSTNGKAKTINDGYTVVTFIDETVPKNKYDAIFHGMLAINENDNTRNIGLSLTSTPLNECCMTALSMIDSINSDEKISVVFLTDGASDAGMVMARDGKTYHYSHFNMEEYYIRDPRTNKIYCLNDYDGEYNTKATVMLMNIISDRVHNLTWFYISTRFPSAITASLNRLMDENKHSESMLAGLTDDGYYELEICDSLNLTVMKIPVEDLSLSYGRDDISDSFKRDMKATGTFKRMARTFSINIA